ncbi:HNH endonuclease signature motif containing protein [Mycolicibacterium baixiangningiae]|uniref:HNH endonuclease signature motif containing protein n=1 Tax=Mycolicibacterium baixiangningiae TaxID=2761578 RepID=UPI0018D0A41E|nr:HNH endonuclease signature motif containing protein [Mycolicibacterium baixiangningiae]
MFDESLSGELVAVIADSYREESKLVGRRVAAVTELLGRRTWEAESEDPDCGYMIVTGLQRTSAEVAAAMNLPPGTASTLVANAEALDSRFPKVMAVLCAGDTDWRTVQIILKRTELVSDLSVLAALDSRLSAGVARWQSWSRKRVINTVDAAVRALDPDAIRERENAEDQRHFDVIPVGNGTAKVDGVLDAESAVIVDEKIAALAKGVCPQDPRTVEQRRADAVAAMAQGLTLACRCPACSSAGTPAPTVDEGRGVRTVINVIADQSTVLGIGNTPGYLAGFGVIDAEVVRRMVERATLRVLTVPTVTAEEMRRYQPTAAVERFVRMRDLTCRFPGCDRPAERCDLDHTIPFNHVDPSKGGFTTPNNLKCLCRHHHRLKTFDNGWHDVQLPDGTIVWTSPTGRMYCTAPGGIELFPRMGPPACVEPKARRRNLSRERSKRIARTRERNRTLRPVNAEARRVAYAREREIEYRKDRNRQRNTLMFFKGHRHSKSPYMRWVNDPYESETLPPDWQAPPDPPTPDGCPF